MNRNDPAAFYDAYGASEWDRLADGIDGRLEFECTVEELARTLPRNGRVLDAGGGAGRYTAWLAERGYDVTLLDVSGGQLGVAREKLAERDLLADVQLLRGSITDLPLPGDAFDATCCLGGPLSHVLDADDRERAVRELRRVSTPDAPVFASVMGLLGALQLYLVTGHNLAALPELARHGDYDDALLGAHGYENEFTATHFFRRDELRALLEDAGIAVDHVIGLEGLASPFHDDALHERLDDSSMAEREALVRTVQATNDDPVVADLSIHMLAVGRA